MQYSRIGSLSTFQKRQRMPQIDPRKEMGAQGEKVFWVLTLGLLLELLLP